MQTNKFLKYQQELSQFTLLQGFSENDLHALAYAFEEKTLEAGEYLFYENDSSSEVYFIRSGKIEVTRASPHEATSQVLAVLEAGQEVGELAVVDGSPRSASARVAGETARLFVMNLENLPVNLMLLSRLLTNTTLVETQKLRRTKHSTAQSQTEQVDHQTLEELQQYPLLNGLSKTDMMALAQVLETKTLQAEDYLFKEYEKSSEVYFIRSGKIDICKSDSSGTEQVIATLGEQQEVGELTLLDGAPRSASAKVTEPGEVWVLNTRRLPNNMALLSHLINNITLTSTDKLRQTNAEHVRSLERELQTTRTQNAFGHFFVYGISLLAVSTIINYLLSHYLTVDIYSNAFGWAYLIIVFIPSLMLVKAMKIPFSSLGVTWNNWRKSVKEAVIASIACIVFFVVAIGGSRYLGLMPEKPLKLGYLVTIPLYFIHSYIQEFIARGIIQSSFQRFFNDKKGIKSIVLASFFFALFHIHFGLGAVAVVFISGLMFGAFYIRHHNLLGVTIFHVVIGTCALVSGLV